MSDPWLLALASRLLAFGFRLSALARTQNAEAQSPEPRAQSPKPRAQSRSVVRQQEQILCHVDGQQEYLQLKKRGIERVSAHGTLTSVGARHE